MGNAKIGSWSCCALLAGTSLVAAAAAFAADAVPAVAQPASAGAPAAVASSRPSAVSADEGSAHREQALPAGQVWECLVDGQKVFSDRSCGKHATVRRLGALNVMDSSTVPRMPPYPYSMGYAPAPYPATTGYQDDGEDAGELGSDAYPTQQVIVSRNRTRYHRRHDRVPGSPAAAHGPASASSAGARSSH